ncbi:MAG: TetR/AcrR family transcriptional regulator [Candidatus Lambdaproteobacteria bacterium]|nr:TetR/AcrR family transcriptional regulator [Candidatus Lambdaproteobacteria bacterium]
MAASVTPLGGHKSTRERIVDAAGSLFAERGFYGASIGALAGGLGVAKASVMHHFKSKDALYDEVMARSAAALHERLRAAQREADDSRERMRRLIRVLYGWTEARPDFTKLVVRNLLDDTRESTAARWHFGPLIADLLAAIEQGQREGAVRAGTPLLVLELILGLAFYHLMARPTQVAILGPEQAAALAVDEAAQVCGLLERAVLLEPPAGKRH